MDEGLRCTNVATKKLFTEVQQKAQKMKRR